MIDAHGISAGAKLFVAHASQDHEAQFGIFAAGDGKDLQAIHFRHVQVEDEQRILVRFQHGEGARAGEGGADFRQHGQMLAEHFLVKIQEILIVIE